MHFFKSTANLAWLFLLLATAITYWLGESGTADAVGIAAVATMMGLALLKGYLVIYDFMELRHAPAKWKFAITGWLGGVLSVIMFAYWLGGR